MKINSLKQLKQNSINKKELKKYFNNKLTNNSYSALGLLEKFMLKNNLILSDSFEAYSKRIKLSRTRLIKFNLYILFNILIFIRYAVLTIYHEQWFIDIQGEFVYKLYNLKITGPMIILVSFTIIQMRLFIWYFESRSKFHCLDLFYNLLTNSRYYRLLDEKYENKYSKILLIAFHIILGKQFNVNMFIFILIEKLLRLPSLSRWQTKHYHCHLKYVDHGHFCVSSYDNELL